MVTTTNGWRLALAAFAAVLTTMTLMMALAGATPAHAESGFCGVRVQGPTFVSGEDEAYTIRNKCSTGHDFRLYFDSNGRYSSCAYVGADGYHTYIESTASQNWAIENC